MDLLRRIYHVDPLLSAGIDESPMPGRSGAITVNFSASNGMIGRHIREVWV